ncbi:hypothetical protein FRC03_006046 [Tulasnella sp. 419]|nr:hypothetical protein FRC03_006046 [Tulasnella sp. 419]
MSSPFQPKRMILAVNCGSSSIKFKLCSITNLHVLISGQAENVVTKDTKPTISYVIHEDDHEEKESEEEQEDMQYDAVFERIIQILEESWSKHFPNGAAARDLIAAVAHRVVHGGTETEPMEIYPGHEEGLTKLEQLSDFAPLHNHRAIQVVKSCLHHLPESHQVLCFDTLFHSTLPEHVYTYPISEPPQPSPIPLRKYGAHGLSYSSILRSVAEYLDKPQDQCNLIIAHLGSGASVCQIRDGKSVDTSMGLTPLDGLPGGTRTGSVDPVLIFHHTPSCSDSVEWNDTKVTKAEMVMNKEGGMQAICGTSKFGIITSKLDDTNPGEANKYQLAYNVFLDRLLNYIGAYLLKSRGQVDGIVFSGGIGEKSSRLRSDVARYFDWMGCIIDQKVNDNVGKEKVVTEITAGDSKIRMFVCMTDEENECARMTLDVMKKQGAVDGRWQ